MPIKAHQLRGYLYIATATLLWGIAASLGRAAFTGRLLGGSLQNIDPLILSQCRTTFSFLILFPVLLIQRGSPGLRLPAADLGRTFLLGVLGVAVSNYFYYVAIQRTNVATAIVVQYTAPVWVLLYMLVAGKQKAAARRIIAVGCAVLGIAIFVGMGPDKFRVDLFGVVAATLAAFSFAFYNIAGHGLLARYDHWIVLLYTTLGTALFWLVINPPWKVAHYSGTQWLFLLVFAVVSMLGPFSLYFAGLKYLEPTRAIVVSCLEPVFSILIAAITLGELMRSGQMLGIILVLGAIVVVQLPDRENPHVVIEPIE